MRDYIISTSSTCDLTKEYLNKNGNPYVKFNFYIDDAKYQDDFFNNFSKDEFFQSIKTHNAKTSQPSPDEYISTWEEILKNDKDVLHIELSSGISGAYNSALIAKNILIEKYSGSKIVVIDSLCASSGLGYLLDIANEKKLEGMSIDDLEKFLNSTKLNINHIVTTTDLTQFFKGGRLSKTAYTFSKLLNVVPILHVSNEGKLEVIKKVRGVNSALNEMAMMMSTNIGIDYNNKIFISNANCLNLATSTLDILKNKFNKADVKQDYIFDIGSVIGAHTGKDTVAIFYIGDKRI